VKFIVIALLVLIVASLGSALFFLYADRSGSRRTAKALTVRVGLSLLLFVLLLAGYYFGAIGNRL
jgi:hypothetical protein